MKSHSCNSHLLIYLAACRLSTMLGNWKLSQNNQSYLRRNTLCLNNIIFLPFIFYYLFIKEHKMTSILLKRKKKNDKLRTTHLLLFYDLHKKQIWCRFFSLSFVIILERYQKIILSIHLYWNI
jgi:hypothetical protein